MLKGTIEMTRRPFWVKLAAVGILTLVLFTTMPFSPAESVSLHPLGTILASDHAMIGNTKAPTGTTFFSGDRVSSDEQVLIEIDNGSRIELIKAAAGFSRQNKRLVIQTDQGLLRFSFKAGEEVEITAGRYDVTAVGDSRHTGELGLNRRGQIAMDVSEGAFAVLNQDTGAQTEVNPKKPLVVIAQGGQGILSNNGRTLTDTSLTLNPDELNQKCIVVKSEAHPVKGNSKDVVTIDGFWKLSTGKYAYKVVDCTEESMI
ncbi:MAG TPA: hypothetical protein VMG30_11435 [Acidobacteriota bacterium]|nr:hypothetical protein [Acidobacteriota bacterium]